MNGIRPIVALVATTQFLVALDGATLVVALPSIAQDFGLSLADLASIQNAYTLGFGSFLITAGRAADILAAPRVFIAGVVLFGVASLVGALAATGEVLAATRGVQGVAAAVVFPAGLAVLADLPCDAAAQARAIGIWSTATALAGPAGAVTSGLLVESFGWRSVLIVQVAPAALAALAACLVLPLRAGPASIGATAWFSGLLLTSSLALAMFWAMDLTGDRGHGSQRLMPSLALATLVAFLATQVRRAEPFLPLGRLRDRHSLGSILVALFGGGSLLSMAFFFNLYLQDVLGMTPGVAGLAYAPLGLGFALTSLVTGRFVSRYGARAVIATGFTIGAISLLWLAESGSGRNYVADALLPSVLTGVSLGLVFAGMTIGAIRAAAIGDRGLAGGLINSAWQLGGLLGLALVVSVDAEASLADSRQALETISWAFRLEAVFALGGLGAALVLLRRPAGTRSGRGHCSKTAPP